ncbi:MAG: hypothetical protein WCE81_02095 [Halobacteriota archaeon]
MSAKKRWILLAIVLFALACISLSGYLSTSGQDPFLKAYVEQWFTDLSKNKTENVTFGNFTGNSTQTLKQWNVSWINSTTAEVHVTSFYNGSAVKPYTFFSNTTVMHFKTVNDASHFVNSHNTGYSLVNSSDVLANNTTYAQVTGHRPVTYVYYDKTVDLNEDHQQAIDEHHQTIEQEDTIVKCCDNRFSVDQTSYFTENFIKNNPGATIITPFYMTTNERGHHVYTGTTKIGTTVWYNTMEIVGAKDQAQKLYQELIMQKINDKGYTPTFNNGVHWEGRGLGGQFAIIDIQYDILAGGYYIFTGVTGT